MGVQAALSVWMGYRQSRSQPSQPPKRVTPPTLLQAAIAHDVPNGFPLSTLTRCHQAPYFRSIRPVHLQILLSPASLSPARQRSRIIALGAMVAYHCIKSFRTWRLRRTMAR